MLNGLIRSALGPLIGSKIDFCNLHVDSGINPSDEPSRFKPLREPEEPPEWISDFLEGSFDEDFQFDSFQNWALFVGVPGHQLWSRLDQSKVSLLP